MKNTKWMNKKTGSTYTVVAGAKLATELPLKEGAPLVVVEAPDGTTWAYNATEFGSLFKQVDLRGEPTAKRDEPYVTASGHEIYYLNRNAVKDSLD